MDEAINSQQQNYTDRLGTERRTWAGIEAENEERITGAIQNIMPLGKQYATLPAAQADVSAGVIAVGAYAYVRSSASASLADEYQNVAGTLTATGKVMLSQQGVNEIISKLMLQVEGKGLYFRDALGRVVTVVDDKGVVAPRSVRKNADGSFGTDAASVSGSEVSLSSGGNKIRVSGPAFLKVTDSLGRSRTIIDDKGQLVGVEQGGGSDDSIAVTNNRNLNYYARVRSQYNAGIERLIFALTHIIVDGQSLSTFQEGYPALSKTAYAALGNLMIGNSCRPSSRTNPAFVPVGAAALTPLVAVTQTADGSAVMTDAEVSALPAGSPNEGEGGVAAVNMLRSLFLKHMSLSSDETRRLLLSVCGVNGRTVEQLSKGASPELYNRVREAVNLARSLATTAGKSYGIGALCFLQGEWNYNPTYGGDTTRAGYRAKVKQLYADFVADFCTGQLPPAMFTYQTSASFTSDTNELAIGMAQLDMAKEGGNYYGVCPSYPFPDKGGHLTSNGYRWMDMFFAKVMFRVLVLGEGWEPLHCTSAEVTDNHALLSYAVPYPPLKWGRPYVGAVATDYADKGFRATDDAGALAITSVEIVADTIVKINFGRNVSGTLKIWYADKTAHNGNGCLQDSDPFVAMENYSYTAGSGQQPAENIAELVNKPYPLNNWAWAQVITVTA
ncbi:hypothetical protein [Erwinia sp. Leaf53]|uniref:hypothetical protein n=1 Tax=Erwinia sp. Leaf53 TaxID=1736225 RepID=UPI0012E2018E|nr:hypothetical protein [Erwinia sp. Leaf53]